MSVSDLIKSVLSELDSVMKTRTVVGDPISAGEFTIIPVSKVSFGFGAGAGGGEKEKRGGSGEGIGGGCTIEPISFFVIGKNGAKMYSVQSEESMTEKLIDLAPKVVEKVKEFVESREGDDSGDKG